VHFSVETVLLELSLKLKSLSVVPWTINV